MNKEFHDLNDVEKHIIRAYIGWKNSSVIECIKIIQLKYWYSRAKLARIEHLISK